MRLHSKYDLKKVHCIRREKKWRQARFDDQVTNTAIGCTALQAMAEPQESARLSCFKLALGYACDSGHIF